tara:strand:+ start:1675 stop:1890 length:216 start_codon:yes stop_codon:yes gene_type:complete
MELINDIFLAPYYLFNYIFSLAVWCILVIYSLNWYQEYNGSDWFQYEFNRLMDRIYDFFVGLKDKLVFWKK